MPNGIQIGGGSDWFCLNHEFINYVVNSDDTLLVDLRAYWRNVLLPSEVSIISTSAFLGFDTH